MRIILPVLALTMLGAAGPSSPARLDSDLRYGPTPIGVEAALALQPDARSPLYVFFVRYTEGQRTPLHSHPDARVTTVLRGTFHGGGADMTASAYPAGSVIHIPANMPHFGWAKDGEVLLQETGSGPTGTTILTGRRP